MQAETIGQVLQYLPADSAERKELVEKLFQLAKEMPDIERSAIRENLFGGHNEESSVGTSTPTSLHSASTYRLSTTVRQNLDFDDASDASDDDDNIGVEISGDHKDIGFTRVMPTNSEDNSTDSVFNACHHTTRGGLIANDMKHDVAIPHGGKVFKTVSVLQWQKVLCNPSNENFLSRLKVSSFEILRELESMPRFRSLVIAASELYDTGPLYDRYFYACNDA